MIQLDRSERRKVDELIEQFQNITPSTYISKYGRRYGTMYWLLLHTQRIV